MFQFQSHVCISKLKLQYSKSMFQKFKVEFHNCSEIHVKVSKLEQLSSQNFSINVED